ncbi:Peptide chain release factor 2 [Dissostichus eleginoides]|uniref:Peptide chain release factor 2 n=1 Tax=Dissostichus eleginoides TaxID=100907 RepID=A0AAD9ENB0_DISEL|nr:Peptide chain release factor 2 [Dissostichus eleginoides]
MQRLSSSILEWDPEDLSLLETALQADRSRRRPSCEEMESERLLGETVQAFMGATDADDKSHPVYSVETESYGTDVIKTVISGSHYSRAHTAHSIIHEVLTSMMFEAFLSKFPERLTELDALQVNCQSKEKNGTPQRSDCYQLKDKFPLLYDSYMNGGFVVNTTKKGSGVPFDQALEQCYNRPAKVSGGIIGVTRKKEAVALWGIIKHKKDQYVELLEMKGDVGGELSLHHAFNPSTATKIVMMVQDIEEYLQKVCSPLQDQHAASILFYSGILGPHRKSRCSLNGLQAPR